MMVQTLAILVLDLEFHPKNQTIFQIGAYRTDTEEAYESPFLRSPEMLQAALMRIQEMACGADLLLGHHILHHDLPLLKQVAADLNVYDLPVMDTLRLSPLAFPQNPYHRLIKNHRLIASELNSPLADCKACWQLFQEQAAQFALLRQKNPKQLAVYHYLMGRLPEAEWGQPIALRHTPSMDIVADIREMVRDEDSPMPNAYKVCETNLNSMLKNKIDLPNESLAYALAWLSVSGGNSVLAPWVRHQFPKTVRLIHLLREWRCRDERCVYCHHTLNETRLLQHYFKLPEFRDVAGVVGGQRAIVQAGMQRQHILAVLPTGGGKSLCFQLPALAHYYQNGGLTIVISPLQSLMKDQVDNLQNRGLSNIDTLNGMLSQAERADVLERISLGDIGILFVAPEQFRNMSFIQAISHRQINGWVFDEAHCLSKWGHDFRPDYLYAAKFIKQHYAEPLAPISCFTATAKPDVLNELAQHFRDELGITFVSFMGGHERTNLDYEVLASGEEHKNQKINEILHRELDHQEGVGLCLLPVGRMRNTLMIF